jgi:hypothetical protein
LKVLECLLYTHYSSSEADHIHLDAKGGNVRCGAKHNQNHAKNHIDAVHGQRNTSKSAESGNYK